MTLYRLLLTLLVLLAAPLRAEETRDFIRISYSNGPWGSYSWTIWSDDRMEYRATQVNKDFAMPGWKWDNRKKESGVARFIDEGGWVRARAVADAALKDPILRETPDLPPEMTDTGGFAVYLTGDEDNPDIVVGEGNRFASAAKTKRFWNRFFKLESDLKTAIEADQLMPK